MPSLVWRPFCTNDTKTPSLSSSTLSNAMEVTVPSLRGQTCQIYHLRLQRALRQDHRRWCPTGPTGGESRQFLLRRGELGGLKRCRGSPSPPTPAAPPPTTRPQPPPRPPNHPPPAISDYTEPCFQMELHSFHGNSATWLHLRSWGGGERK